MPASRESIDAYLERLEIEPRFHALLADLSGGEVQYLREISAEDLAGCSDGDGKPVPAPVARGIIRKLQGLSDGSAAPAPSPLVALPTDNVHEFRKAVKAAGLPDEGMRGSAADHVKLQAASEPDVRALLAKALRGKSSDAAAAAAAVRSVAITPTSANAVCDGAVAVGLCSLIRRAGPMVGPAHKWAIPAIARLAQHRETHASLMQAGVVQVLAAHAHNRTSTESSVRLDLVASMALALLSETGETEVARKVPVRVVKDFVALLERRLFIQEPEEVVSQRIFFGLPLFVRPRFVLDALSRLAKHSGVHGAMAWQTRLPEILVSLIDGTLPNDAEHSTPFGSLDAQTMAKVCGKAILEAGAGSGEQRELLHAAVAQEQSKL